MNLTRDLLPYDGNEQAYDKSQPHVLLTIVVEILCE